MKQTIIALLFAAAIALTACGAFASCEQQQSDTTVKIPRVVR